MPNYDFRCSYCGYRWERNVPMSQRNVRRPCPNCGNLDGERQASAPAFQLKGKGFHVNDYPKKPG